MHLSKPQVAVLMLCYNGAEDCLEAIRSFQGQEAWISSITICDNMSTDSSRERLLEYRQELNFELLLSLGNGGYAGGFNLLFEDALQKSTCPYFLVINNDVVAGPNLLPGLLQAASPERILSPMILWARDRETVIQSAGEFDWHLIKMVNAYEGKRQQDVPSGVHLVGQTDGCCFLIHRRWLEAGFRFDARMFMYYEDMDLFWRLRQQGAIFAYVADAVLYHKEYGSTGDRTQPSPLREYYFYRNRCLMARKHLPLLKAWRAVWRVYRLAQARRKELRNFPAVSSAIRWAFIDFLFRRFGRRRD